MIRPNFFLVGAPKCATTSVYHTLRKHPEVFMPHDSRENHRWLVKEPNYFCPDLEIALAERIVDEHKYLNLFARAPDRKRVGEASVAYLFSEDAPELIKRYSGDCKILIGIRHPVDWMRSWHYDMICGGNEDVADFARAIELSEARMQGLNIPKLSNWKKCLAYKRLACFSPYIERYFGVFGRENVHVFTTDDLKSDPVSAYRAMFSFLGIQEEKIAEPLHSNKSSQLPNGFMITKRVKRYLQLCPPVYHIGREIYRKRPQFVSTVTRKIKQMLPASPSSELDATLRRSLTAEFSSEIDKLSELLNRDLSGWKHV